MRCPKILVTLLLAVLLAACGGSATVQNRSTGVPSSNGSSNVGQAAATSAPQSSGSNTQRPTQNAPHSEPKPPVAVAPTQAPDPNQSGPVADAPQNSTGAMATAAPASTSAGADAVAGGAPPATENSTKPTRPTTRPQASDGPYDSTYYQNYGTNPFVATEEDRLSTFAMDIDTASYTIMRRYLNDGNLPDSNSVRPEEYLNYFDYRYPQPDANSEFAIYTEAAPSPWGGKGYEMLQIGIQGRAIEAADRAPTSLTFVIDISGSMNREDRLETVKQALGYLVKQMRAEDQVGIVVYGSEARSVLPPTRGNQQERIMRAINGLEPSGATNVEAGLDIGFDQASEAFIAGGSNMILLCSDGVANNGVTDPEALVRKYQSQTKRGIKLSTYGFGMGNFNDVLMERLADAGNGFYTYIDTPDEAQRVFVQNLAGTLQLIARDAKIQVDFNPAVVDYYRLIGYENRDVADQDFRNDSTDAGEVGAGHSVTALYEIRRSPRATGDLATVRVRYHRIGNTQVAEINQTVGSDSIHRTVNEASGRFKLAVSVAEYAELLRHSRWTRGTVLDDVVAMANEAHATFRNDSDVTEFTQLVRQAADLAPAQQ